MFIEKTKLMRNEFPNNEKKMYYSLDPHALIRLAFGLLKKDVYYKQTQWSADVCWKVFLSLPFELLSPCKSIYQSSNYLVKDLIDTDVKDALTDKDDI